MNPLHGNQFSRLKAALSLPNYQVVGILGCFEFLKENTPPRLLTPTAIALCLEWDGSPGELYEALIYAGYIVEVPRNN